MSRVTSLSRARARLRGSWLGLACAAIGASGAIALAVPAGATATGLSTSTCQLGGAYQHVVYIQFDNQHLSRDLPNVPSDLEQVPALKNFLANNGTLLDNHHTPLISHTSGDIVTSLTGLYPDRNGIGVGNSYAQYEPGSGAVPTKFPSAFTYWTDPVSATDTDDESDHRRAEEHAGSVGSLHPRRLRCRRVLAQRHGDREHQRRHQRGVRRRFAAAAVHERYGGGRRRARR